jgi:hypothetical protein
LARLKPVYLGDDLYSRQPICESVQALKADFLFTAKPTSHPTLMAWLAGIEPPSRAQRVKKGRGFQTHRYRWLEGVPIRDGKDALIVNWLEIEIVNRRRQGHLQEFLGHLAAGHRGQCRRTRRLRPRPLEDREREFQRAQDQGVQSRAQLRPRQKKPRSPTRHHEPSRLRLAYAVRSHRKGLAKGTRAYRHAKALLSGHRGHHRIPSLPKLGRPYPNPHRRPTTPGGLASQIATHPTNNPKTPNAFPQAS